MPQPLLTLYFYLKFQVAQEVEGPGDFPKPRGKRR